MSEAPKQAAEAYHSEASRTLIAVVELLGPLTLQGATLAELVRASERTRSRVFRALRNLEAAGWAEQRGEVWRLTPRVTRLADDVRRALADASQHWLGPGS